MTDDQLVVDVADELSWDPKVDSESIAVFAKDGAVTLRGTVESFREKREAKKAAENVYGVTSVDSELKVRLMTDGQRDDADLRADVLQALMLDSLVPATIDVAVNDSAVTLTGTAEYAFQRDEAIDVASTILGVTDVWDEVALTGPPAHADDIEHAIKKAYKRSARLDADALTIETKENKVTLKGTVRSWAEHDDAVDAAWAAPGVREVDDRIAVLY
jgi:osmotically-inducible protein OsmY